MLKKQTVWLLTMLSLIVVLSVYYITTPSGSSMNQAAVGDQGKKTDGAKSATVGNAAASDGLKSVVASDDPFATYRLERDDAHAKLSQQLEQMMTADSSTAVQVSAAHDQLMSLRALSSKETMVEDLVMSKGYNDAVVSTDGQYVNVYVQANNLSNKQVNAIMVMVHKQLGDKQVRVTREPVKK